MSRRGIARHNAKRDANEPLIVDALEAQGFVVKRLNGGGCPDLLVAKGGRLWLAEVKAPKGVFTVKQQEWRKDWTGPRIVTLRSVDDALRFMLLACECPTTTETEPRT